MSLQVALQAAGGDERPDDTHRGNNRPNQLFIEGCFYAAFRAWLFATVPGWIEVGSDEQSLA